MVFVCLHYYSFYTNNLQHYLVCLYARCSFYLVEGRFSLISYCLRNGLSANFTETLDMLRFYHKIVTYESRERRFKLPETRS